MKCPICADELREAFRAPILGKYEAVYRQCPACGFLGIRDPHWLDEAYAEAIAITDTGLVSRNLSLSRRLVSFLYLCLHERGRGRYLDYAGGYGLLTRLMRDIGVGFYWLDRYTPNLLAKGFEYTEHVGPCRAVTAFEVLEHVVDPVGFIHEALETGGADTLVFSTELFRDPPPPPEDWFYYSPETGQHISFFQHRTLERLAQRTDLHFSTEDGIHVFSRHRIPRALLRFALGRRTHVIGSALASVALRSRTLDDHNDLVRGARERRASRPLTEHHGPP